MLGLGCETGGLYDGIGRGPVVGGDHDWRGAGLTVRDGELHTGAPPRAGPPFENVGRPGWYGRPG